MIKGDTAVPWSSRTLHTFARCRHQMPRKKNSVKARASWIEVHLLQAGGKTNQALGNITEAFMDFVDIWGTNWPPNGVCEWPRCTKVVHQAEVLTVMGSSLSRSYEVCWCQFLIPFCLWNHYIITTPTGHLSPPFALLRHAACVLDNGNDDSPQDYKKAPDTPHPTPDTKCLPRK